MLRLFRGSRGGANPPSLPRDPPPPTNYPTPPTGRLGGCRIPVAGSGAPSLSTHAAVLVLWLSVPAARGARSGEESSQPSDGGKRPPPFIQSITESPTVCAHTFSRSFDSERGGRATRCWCSFRPTPGVLRRRRRSDTVNENVRNKHVHGQYILTINASCIE